MTPTPIEFVESSSWTIGRFAAMDLAGVVHAVTTRRGLDVMRVWTEPGWAAQAIAGHVGLPQAAWIEQIHSDIVLPVTAGGFAGQGDGLVTATPGVALVGRSADCPLILLADVEAGVVGMAHASWRGTVQLIARRMVEAAVQLGGRPERMVACICPSAGPCCYEVGPDVLAAAVAGIGPEAERFFAPENGDWLLFRRLKKVPVPFSPPGSPNRIGIAPMALASFARTARADSSPSRKAYVSFICAIADRAVGNVISGCSDATRQPHSARAGSSTSLPRAPEQWATIAPGVKAPSSASSWHSGAIVRSGTVSRTTCPAAAA